MSLQACVEQVAAALDKLQLPVDVTRNTPSAHGTRSAPKGDGQGPGDAAAGQLDPSALFAAHLLLTPTGAGGAAQAAGAGVQEAAPQRRAQSRLHLLLLSTPLHVFVLGPESALHVGPSERVPDGHSAMWVEATRGAHGAAAAAAVAVVDSAEWRRLGKGGARASYLTRLLQGAVQDAAAPA